MARLLKNVSPREADIPPLYRCTIYTPIGEHASSKESKILLPTNVGIPFYKDAIQIFPTLSSGNSQEISCLILDKDDNEILNVAVSFMRNFVVVEQEHTYILEKMYSILEKKDEYVDILYCFAAVEGCEILLDNFVANMIGVNYNDIREFSDIIRYNTQIGKYTHINVFDNVLALSNEDSEIIEFYIRVPIKIQQFRDIHLAIVYGTNSVGEFIQCIYEEAWRMPLVDIDVSKLIKR
jgi:hypothetical protein